MGAIFWYPVVSSTFSSFVQWARSREPIFMAPLHMQAQDYRQHQPYQSPLILLMGSEREGLTPLNQQFVMSW